MADSPFDSLLFTEAHYREIGKVAANWAAFETIAVSALWMLADVKDEPGACLTAQIPNMARRMDALEALLRLRGASDFLLRKVHKFGSDTYGLQEQRNRIVHDPWHVDKDGQLNRLEITAKGKLKFGHIPFAVAEITRAVFLISEHIKRFSELMREIDAAHGPFPGMRRKASP